MVDPGKPGTHTTDGNLQEAALENRKKKGALLPCELIQIYDAVNVQQQSRGRQRLCVLVRMSEILFHGRQEVESSPSVTRSPTRLCPLDIETKPVQVARGR